MVDFKRPLACDGYFLVFLLRIDTDVGLRRQPQSTAAVTAMLSWCLRRRMMKTVRASSRMFRAKLGGRLFWQ